MRVRPRRFFFLSLSPPAHVRVPDRRRASRRAGGKARGKPPAGSQSGGGRTGGVWNVPLSEKTRGEIFALLAFLLLPFAY